MKNFIMNKKYLWINIIFMIITYGLWAIVYFILRFHYSKENNTKNLKTMTLNVSGVTFKNDDGTDRQKYISELSLGQELKLVQYKYEGKDAVYVKTLDNRILGNIPKNYTLEICNKLSNSQISKITVFEFDKFLSEDNKNIYYLKIMLFIKK